MSKQKDTIKIWESVKNILNKFLNTETSNPYTCLRHFSTLCMKEDKGLLVMEVQIIDLDHTDEFDNDMTCKRWKKLPCIWKTTKQQDLIVYQQRQGRCWLLKMKDLKF